MQSTCRVTPAANANDSKKCEIISVETGMSKVQAKRDRGHSHGGMANTIYSRSPIFSRVNGRSPQKYGRDEMSMTARERV
jgi:hypothetical protein